MMVMVMVMVIIEPGMFKRTMVAVSTTRLLALVHIITMGPVTLLMIVTFSKLWPNFPDFNFLRFPFHLKALVAMTSVVEDSVSASCFFVAPVNPRAKVKL